MREWLDHRRCETCSFRQIFIAGGLALQIGFLNFPDATTFADPFDGQLMEAHQVDIDQMQAQGPYKSILNGIWR